MTAPIEKEFEEHEEATDDNNDEANANNNNEPSNEPEVIAEYASKTVKKLSKDERAMLMTKFDKGEEDPYFKVIRMANGQTRITKRRTPLNQSTNDINEKITVRATKHAPGSKLTNEQLLMEHIFDLEARFEAMRMKHKKLKKRYNELESSIYETDDTVAQQAP